MKNKNNIIIGITAIFIYFSYTFFELAILSLLNIDYETLSMWKKVLFLTIMESIELIILISLFKNQLKENLKDLKENHEKYFKEYFKYWLYILLVMSVSNIIITMITYNKMSGNEESVRNLVVKNPLYAYFSSVIVAPVMEELVFRRGIRNIIKDKTLFILVSGLLFGSLHIITGFSGIQDLLYLIPYCFPGLVFAYILAKTDNVLIPISIHLLHNGILVSSQIFIYMFLT